jgi:porin
MGTAFRAAIRLVRLSVAAALLLGATAMAVRAQALLPPDEHGITQPSIATSLPQRGDPGHLRQWLADHGVVYTLIYTNDLLSNVHGGSRVGTIDQGKFEGILRIDLEKLAGFQGLSFFANVFQIHNTGRIRRDYVGGINTIAAIEANPATRLSELWLEQKFLSDKASLRVGQLAADAEFFYSDLSVMFLQSDWPTIAAVNLPSGGAAYPLSTPGVRLKVEPAKDVALLLAVFNGDPAGPGTGDEQLRNRYGLNFRVNDPPFVIGELQLRRNHGKEDIGLASTLKLGGWTHFGQFDDKRFADDGTLLADPAGSGVPLQHRGNAGVYAVAEQQLYRPKGGDAQSGVSVFSRVSFSPTDRNLINAYVDGGVVFDGLIPQRPNDKFGASVIYARYSDSVRAFDRDTAAFTGVAGPVRDYETNLELSYMAEIVPGWTVQPTLQFVWHPSGDAARNATVAGVRSMWRY